MNSSLETILSIDNIRVMAHHGWYESERKLGGFYSISVQVFSTFPSTQSFDEMDISINYEQIHETVLSVMNEEFKLIEQCCKVLFERLKQLKPSEIWQVHLIKEDVPIKHVGSTSFCIKG
jgi:7,8-dihydroneopterin aldolase/epimerase/oxygenase